MQLQWSAIQRKSIWRWVLIECMQRGGSIRESFKLNSITINGFCLFIYEFQANFMQRSESVN